MKVVGMIPARMGSKRVPKKNIRLLNGRPLIDYILETVSKTDLFDEVFINSEDDLFKDLASAYGFNFYKRPSKFSTDSATNDEFAEDFLKNIKCDLLIQMLPTSPFINTYEIESFIKKMLEEDLDTLISVDEKQIGCVYENEPINFDKNAPNPPSQTMESIKVYATALMGWKSKNFLENMKKLGCAYHGGEGNISYFPMKGLATIDIDTEDDFILAESIISSLSNRKVSEPSYYEGGSIHSEVDVPSILMKDGITKNDLHDVNHELVCVKKIIEENPKDVSWSKRIIDSDSNSMTVISQIPGEGNRRHYHPDWNEWWYIYEGKWEWDIEGEKKIVREGDIVYMEKNRVHKITAVGDSRAVRFAVSRSDVAHIYV